MSTMRTQALPWVGSSSGRASNATAAIRKTMRFLLFMASLPSGSVCHPLAQQAGRPHGQRQDQDDESEDVAVLAAQHAASDGAQVTGTDGFDEAEQDAADHRTGQVADAAEHGRREGLQA